MKTKRTGLALCAMLFALSLPVEAQQSTKIPRIGYVSPSGDANNPGARVEAFRLGLRDLGYIEGKNILVEYRYAGGMTDRLVSLVAELVQLKVDVLIVTTTTGVRAAKQATKTIPVVIATNGDPVALGLIDSLARPGGNVTGISLLTVDLSGKRLELLREVVPTISRVAVLLPGDIQAGTFVLKSTRLRHML
jgi:putative ABC transport system substrate-binding protein